MRYGNHFVVGPQGGVKRANASVVAFGGITDVRHTPVERLGSCTACTVARGGLGAVAPVVAGYAWKVWWADGNEMGAWEESLAEAQAAAAGAQLEAPGVYAAVREVTADGAAIRVVWTQGNPPAAVPPDWRRSVSSRILRWAAPLVVLAAGVGGIVWFTSRRG